jgi:hypothetical protein
VQYSNSFSSSELGTFFGFRLAIEDTFFHQKLEASMAVSAEWNNYNDLISEAPV